MPAESLLPRNSWTPTSANSSAKVIADLDVKASPQRRLRTLLNESRNRLDSAGDKTLAECFGIFALIHQVTTSLTAIKRITREVLEDCAADNIIFAELRTTPKVCTAIICLGGQGPPCRILTVLRLRSLGQSMASPSSPTSKLSWQGSVNSQVIIHTC